MMIAFTSDAQAYLDRYLRQMKAALSGSRSVDPQEVERDVLGHIEAELPDNEPVTLDSLHSVLNRLGSPNQWLAVEELPLWRQVLLRLRSGPEDWRLAYLTFACFVVGPLLGPIGPLFLLASFPLARATLTSLDERDAPIGARRWLIYPPLVLWYASFALLLLFWPVGGTVAALNDVSFWRFSTALLRDPRVHEFLRPTAVILAAVLILGVGLWWMILGLLLTRAERLVRAAFRPFADRFERRHAMRLAVSGLALAGLGALLFAAGKHWQVELESAGRLFSR
jgi:hypothetical protein